MVVLLEHCIVLHGSLLQLHVDAAAVDGDHLLDSAETDRNRKLVGHGVTDPGDEPVLLKQGKDGLLFVCSF